IQFARFLGGHVGFDIEITDRATKAGIESTDVHMLDGADTAFASQSGLPAAFNRIAERAQHAHAGYHDASTRQRRLLNSTLATAGYCPHKDAARQLHDDMHWSPCISDPPRMFPAEDPLRVR